MTRILMVDDDPLVLRMYQRGLSQLGHQVDTISDGLAAMKWLQGSRPDLLVLDLMMPQFTGVDVLKFVRAQSSLKTLPVVVLSNSYMDGLSKQAAAMGVERALLKVRCSPTLLHQAITEVLDGTPSTIDISAFLASAPVETGLQAAPAPAPDQASDTKPKVETAAAGLEDSQAMAADFQLQAQANFRAKAPDHARELNELLSAIASATDPKTLVVRVGSLYRKVHFLSAMTGLAGLHDLALLASVYEAFLFELTANPTRMTPSALHTVQTGGNCLVARLSAPGGADGGGTLAARVLVVDDDPLACRAAVSALRAARLEARSSQKPLEALQWLGQERYDLLLLDISMPGMDGIEFCRQVRTLAGYERTPVIYVTAHSRFLRQVRTTLAGGNDLIAKPFFPIELAVKSVIHLFESRVAASAPDETG
jgi:CheY-like chemotaxis protein